MPPHVYHQCFNHCSYRYRDPRLTGAKENPVSGVNIVNLYEDEDYEEPPMDYGEASSTPDLVPEKTPIN